MYSLIEDQFRSGIYYLYETYQILLQKLESAGLITRK